MNPHSLLRPPFPFPAPPPFLVQPHMLQQQPRPMPGMPFPFYQHPPAHATPFQHQQLSSLLGFTEQEEEKMRTFYLGNISAGVDDYWIEKLLSVCGALAKWKRVRNTDGTLKAFGFATYREVDSVQRALAILGGESTKSGLPLELPSMTGGPWKRLMLKLDSNTEKLMDKYRAARPVMPNDAEFELQCRARAEEVLSAMRMQAPPLDVETTLSISVATIATTGTTSKKKRSSIASDPYTTTSTPTINSGSVDDAVDQFLNALKPNNSISYSNNHSRGSMDDSAGNNDPSMANAAPKPVFNFGKSTIGSAFQKLTPTVAGKRRTGSGGDGLSLAHDDENGEEALGRKRTKLVALDYSTITDDDKTDPIETPVTVAVTTPILQRDASGALDENSVKRDVLARLVPPEDALEQVLSYPVRWDHLSAHVVQSKIRLFVQLKLGELLGAEQEEMVGYVVDKMLGRVNAQELVDELEAVLDEDAVKFVVRLWRMVIFESEVAAMLECAVDA